MQGLKLHYYCAVLSVFLLYVSGVFSDFFFFLIVGAGASYTRWCCLPNATPTKELFYLYFNMSYFVVCMYVCVNKSYVKRIS
jgi:hypothetical protein